MVGLKDNPVRVFSAVTIQWFLPTGWYLDFVYSEPQYSPMAPDMTSLAQEPHIGYIALRV